MSSLEIIFYLALAVIVFCLALVGYRIYSTYTFVKRLFSLSY